MSHWREVRKVWKYLKTTKNLKLTIKYDPQQEVLSSFSDATWGDDPVFRKSQTGYVVFHYGSPVVWNSTRQQNITYSSTESELNALLDCYLETKWIRHLINEIYHDCKFKPTLYIDNKGLDDKIKKFGSHSKSRHIDIKTKGLRDDFTNKEFKLELIPSPSMVADSLLKASSISSLKLLQKTIFTT